MIVVVAARGDVAARRLADRWSAVPARILTATDLAAPGWRVSTGDPARGRAVVAGEVVDVADITGVLTRLPAVGERELLMIREADRAYAATEMTAFLSYWLSTLPGPVLNGPAHAGLCGPGWRGVQWLLHARRCGIPVRPWRRHTAPFRPGAEPEPEPGPPESGDLTTCSVIGDQVIGSDDEVLQGHARALARAAGVGMVAVVFRGHAAEAWLVEAHTWVDVTDDAVADALLEHLTAGRETCA